MFSIGMAVQMKVYGTNLGIDDQGFLFFYGCVIYTLQITLSYLNASLKLNFAQVLISFGLCFWVLWSPNFYFLKYQFGASQLFVLFMQYTTQKNQRENFLLRDSEREWSKIVKKVVNSSIITVKYDQKNNQLKLDMINDQTKKILNLSNSEDFKSFSRKTIVFDRFQDYQEDDPNSSFEERNKAFSLLEINKQTQKNTLENRIISTIKQYISYKINNNDQEQNQVEYSPEIIKKPTRMSVFTPTSQFNPEKKVADLFYAVYKTDDNQEEKRISIKATAYQNQTEYHCCLVINEETNRLKTQCLEKINQSLQSSLFEFCIYTGDKLQNIMKNISKESIIRANISQCFNFLYNYKDHANTIKNQFKMKFDNFNISQQSLEQIENQIYLRYLNKIDEIQLKFQLINCNHDTQITTYTDQFLQCLMNLIENSIKFQQNNIKCSSYNQNSCRTQISLNEINSNRHLKSRKYSPSFSPRFLKQINFQEEEKQEQANLNINELLSQNSNSKGNEIIISLELIEGDNEKSNIFKVTVQDSGKGMSINKIQQTLEIIGTKSPAFNFNYQSYKQIGWKVNHQIIGKLGPFYNFFVLSEINKGLVFHFYIFQDVDILLNKDFKQLKLFQNQLFQKYLEESKKTYYHIDNIQELRQSISNQNFSPINRLSSVTNQYQNRPSLFSQFPGNIDQQLNDTISISSEKMQKTLNSPKNLDYQMSKIYTIDKIPTLKNKYVIRDQNCI
ncbi:transmembrane protein, putative (macronuclear) [Tetrahymena thermophila SB210]|uniref:Transmembrane protein, putative n=1 Tax=Tetrahymena thermophila (strain SB210) TaxID=312017 RepID=Q24DQ3_TETTS|nr:transmembrane protein, putative [Tetrahymena thermophila SB210]EAS05937.2 transmembrane protein, putative [Tetrahymena thermophila SB210]|eukprot:XP_001026182.2 transmembrane protein, putative [Tetrahymena thermophila SB210]